MGLPILVEYWELLILLRTQTMAHVTGKILSCSNLDGNLNDWGHNKVDPYVIVTTRHASHEQEFRTQTIPNACSPHWHDNNVFDSKGLDLERGVLEFRVLDKDLGFDRPL